MTNNNYYFPEDMKCIGEKCLHKSVSGLLRIGVEAGDLRDFKCRQQEGMYCYHFNNSRRDGEIKWKKLI